MGRSDTGLEQAIVRRICAYLEIEADLSTVDHAAPLVTDGQFSLAGHVLDSLSLAEAIVVLESDLDVSILGSAELTEIESAAALARYLARASSVEDLTAFERRWTQ